MTFRINFAGNRLVITGLGVVVLVLAALALFHHSEMPDPDQASREVRHFLQWKVNQEYLGELKAGNLTVPEYAMALRWKQELERVKSLEILSVAVARPLLAHLHGRRSYVVKVVVRDLNQQDETRYFNFGPWYPVSPYFAKSEPPKYAKARRSQKGMAFPLLRTATPHWCIWTAPFGQDDKRPPALLRSLALATASPAFARLASGRLSSC